MYFPTRGSYRRCLDVFKEMMNTITLRFRAGRISPVVIGASGLANSQRFASCGLVWRYSHTYIGKDYVEG